jgi:hypothetical protein
MSNKATLDLEKIFAKLKKNVKRSFSAREMNKIGNFIVEEIRSRSRAGYGVKTPGGAEKKFKGLNAAYIKQRRRMRLSSFTTPSTSNITRSGRLLAGLRYKTKDGGARIEPSGTSREGVDNTKIAEYLADQGRPFMNLSKYQMDRLLKFIKKEIINLD